MAKEKFGKKDIFSSASNNNKEEIEVVKKKILPESPRMIIHSFRIREDLVDRLREYAFFEKTKIYKVVNQAMEDFLKNYKPRKNTPSS